MGTVAPFPHQQHTIQALGQGPSVLGERNVRIPVGGYIRAGNKVLTPAAAHIPRAVALYERGVAAGAKWDDVERTIIDKCRSDLPTNASGNPKSPLMPNNPDHFTLLRARFDIPEVADRILDLYAEDRGQGRKLYRFPVMFQFDHWLANLPHGFAAHNGREKLFWSDYGPDGTRYCYTRGKVEVDPRARRARRTFGGRPVMLRQDNGGICNPDACPQYQRGECQMKGRTHFYIPGIPGAALIDLAPLSINSLEQCRGMMETVRFSRGRIAGVKDDGSPIFWVTKRRAQVNHIDPKTGEATRVWQWLSVLEADIDMSEVFLARETQPALPAGAEAAAILEGEHHDATSAQDPKPAPEPDQPTDGRKAVKEARAELAELLEQVGIGAEKFSTYASLKWGEPWSRSLDALQLALEEVRTAAGEDIEAYRQKVNDPVPF